MRRDPWELCHQLGLVKDKPPTTPEPSRGLGDTVAKVTSAVGIKPCGGCKARQKWLNEKIPYKRGETP